MTYIKKHLPSLEILQEEYEKDPVKFVEQYSKYEVFFGSSESMKFLHETIKKHLE